jgi:hypothetical protein
MIFQALLHIPWRWGFTPTHCECAVHAIDLVIMVILAKAISIPAIIIIAIIIIIDIIVLQSQA